jgi:hypothetical protein
VLRFGTTLHIPRVDTHMKNECTIRDPETRPERLRGPRMPQGAPVTGSRTVVTGPIKTSFKRFLLPCG